MVFGITWVKLGGFIRYPSISKTVKWHHHWARSRVHADPGPGRRFFKQLDANFELQGIFLFLMAGGSNMEFGPTVWHAFRRFTIDQDRLVDKNSSRRGSMVNQSCWSLVVPQHFKLHQITIHRLRSLIWCLPDTFLWTHQLCMKNKSVYDCYLLLLISSWIHNPRIEDWIYNPLVNDGTWVCLKIGAPQVWCLTE